MDEKDPPIKKWIAPGNRYLERDYDMTSIPPKVSIKIGSLVVEKGDKVSFRIFKMDLTDVLHHILAMFEVKFRPSFFPFTEPSAEVDISCIFCKGEGCKVCFSNKGF